MESILVLAKYPFRLVLSLAGWLARVVGKILIVPVLEQSHQVYLDLRRWQLRWHELQNGIQYKLVLESVFSNDPAPVSTIYVRNSGAQTIDRLDIGVVAHSGNLRYPDSAVVLKLPPKCVASCSLRNIPLQDLWTDEKGISRSYDSFEVLPLQLVQNGVPLSCESSQPVRSPTYTDFLNGHWVRFLGRVFNINAIEEQKTKRLHAVYFSLLGRFGIVSMTPRAQVQYILRYRLFRFLPNVAMYWLLSRNWALELTCWIPLILRRQVLRFEVEAS